MFQWKFNPFLWAVKNFGLVHHKIGLDGVSTPRKEPTGVMECSSFFWTRQLTFSRKMSNQNINNTSKIPRSIKNTALCQTHGSRTLVFLRAPRQNIYRQYRERRRRERRQSWVFLASFTQTISRKWNTYHYRTNSETIWKTYSCSEQQLLFKNTPVIRFSRRELLPPQETWFKGENFPQPRVTSSRRYSFRQLRCE